MVELVDLASKQAPNGVKTKDPGEGREIGCRGEAGVARVGCGVRVLPAAGGSDASSDLCSLAAGRLGSRGEVREDGQGLKKVGRGH